MALNFHMQGFSGYGVQYSPFFDNRLAVASGSNFGLVGNGNLFILDIDPQGRIHSMNSFMTQDCLYDVAWNELHENQVLVAQGDGSLRLFDTSLQKFPIAIFKEHSKEVLSCNWNLINKQTFVSSSWDGTVKIWTPNRKESLRTLQVQPVMQSQLVDNTIAKTNGSRGTISANKNCIYQAQFSPHDENLVMCCSGNSYVTLFDLRQPNSNNKQQRFLAHNGSETLTCDFNKYRPTVVATSGVDSSIRIWDIRMLVNLGPQSQHINSSAACINEITRAHELAVRKVAWSPHHPNVLLSASYDMTCSVWQDLSYDGSRFTMKTNSIDSSKGFIKRFTGHSEFVFGADWSLWGQPGFIATTGWDGNVFLWNGLQR
ncbi:hypothetical protein Kpol_1036p65 [Vanderwaltozyma polyspora DSM 70294]|uniref:Peroxin-7 n=1 Tax=Vanderwaltozyma polyspora (strain ATCC 22028 / DSM 70294 / BCRC 21397 / CBS 2163 / NBRC 10782 / NRRL Y-8283 / UCD 57-17) TaxID=436907 RepID=A7TEL3_VANPO|nr:uncharacterized protein Kpol_1036p65 [Vanderwaltozyma polyspora DSM 70294]EDO19320.1 hypothetical protein Kpol_1036p65 [Vanderwaltozyma polyspora DSM 70294]